ncbi:PREDICTED: E3 ubiquitin-protein ligase RHF2A-like [Ipomoea nil]|uniref:E3 ubiquitin-protein ligase RHF2A-like n=1 Tax=Ipomoea nil TaxID=35883 RepID=UPI000900D676|nr:PREDICTED: E3 ubiquitin-protein ligase RHF2A-like [Ipomoea nil]XP_019164022.1 PREDICTED: E3 ubiquitin-protein ligase RHF2A-like [Ipomoea nil]
MCWQALSLKDPNSQELFDAVEHERNIRMHPPRNTAHFHHPNLGEFELQHLPVSATDSELEERIIQHLAAAAAMGRARHLARREGQRGRPSAQGRPHFLVFSTNPNAPAVVAASPPPTQRSGGEPASVVAAGPTSSIIAFGEGSAQLIAPAASIQSGWVSSPGSGSSGGVTQPGSSSNNRRSPQSSPSNQDRAGPSDFQSFSESLKSRFSAMSTRYKESITKSTRGWKERLFSRNNTTVDHGSESRNAVSADIAAVSRLMEHLETTETSRTPLFHEPNRLEENLPPDHRTEQQISGIDSNLPLAEGNRQAPCATTSAFN